MSFVINNSLRDQILQGVVSVHELALHRQMTVHGTVYEMKKIADLDPLIPQDQIIAKADSVMHPELSLKEWIAVQRCRWKDANTSTPFVVWVCCEREEQRAWKREHPGKVCTEEQLSIWRETQEMPSSMLSWSKWYWKKLYEADTSQIAYHERPSFENWMHHKEQEMLQYFSNIILHSQGMIPLVAMSPHQIKQLSQKMFEWRCSMIIMDGDVYVANAMTPILEKAIMAAGEIRTNAEGKIEEICPKSGHYCPSHKENIAMLKWFQDRGVDLNTVYFTYLNDQCNFVYINANLYMTQHG